MSKEEFFDRLRKFSDEMEAMEAHAKAFHVKLRQDLFDLVFDSCPEMAARRQEMDAPLRKLVEKYSRETMECLNVAENYSGTAESVPIGNPVPQPLTEKDAEKRALELYDRVPDVDLEECRQFVWEDFEWQLKRDHFKHRVHQLMKQALSDFYLDNLLKLEADNLLLLNRYLWVIGAYQFTDDLLELKSKAKSETD